MDAELPPQWFRDRCAAIGFAFSRDPGHYEEIVAALWAEVQRREAAARAEGVAVARELRGWTCCEHYSHRKSERHQLGEPSPRPVAALGRPTEGGGDEWLN